MRFIAILFLSTLSFADQDTFDMRSKPEPTLDPRLPPVLPGEEVERGGNRMKVWSSSGPVYVQDLNPQKERAIDGVIVDKREQSQKGRP